MKPRSLAALWLSLAVWLCLAVTGPVVWAVERVALVIGNDAYPDVVDDVTGVAREVRLANCVNDARAVRDMLRDQLGFPEEGLIYGENLTRREFYERLEAFRKAADGSRMAVVFYAGHGMESLDGRENFLIPVDADLVGAAESESLLRSTGVNLSEILGYSSRATAGPKVVLLDCCRDRPAKRSLGGLAPEGGGLAQIPEDQLPADTLILLAAAPNRQASDGRGHGPFTRALLDHLPKGGQSILEAFFKVSDAVQEATARQQIPWLKFDGSGAIFRQNALVSGPAVVKAEVKAGAAAEAASLNAPAGAPMSAMSASELEAARKRIAELEAQLKGFAQSPASAPSPGAGMGSASPGVEEVAVVSPAPGGFALQPAPAPAPVMVAVPIADNDDEAPGPAPQPPGLTLRVAEASPGIRLGVTGGLSDAYPNPPLVIGGEAYPNAGVFGQAAGIPVPALESGAVGDFRTISLGRDVVLTLKYVPAGEFLMGSPPAEAGRNEDEQQVAVALTAPFWMGETEVTRAQWQAVMGGTSRDPSIASRPMTGVGFSEAQPFLARLNALALLPAGWQWALPTEAQWEWACRGGTETAYGYGEALRVGQAVFGGAALSAVKSGLPNAYGLHDMHGNASETCSDLYRRVLPGGRDPAGADSGTLRVVRGGSCVDAPEHCRSAHRETAITPGLHQGLRLVVVRAIP